jgi:hypothetical protein
VRVVFADDVADDARRFLVGAGRYRINVNGVSGQTIILQTSTDLQNWLPLATNALTSANWIYTNVAPMDFGRQFYRAALQ